MNNRPLLFCILLLVFTIFSGCKPGAENPAGSGAGDTAGRPTVLTVNYPLAYFAERIGGDAIDVVFNAPADEDPAFWEPSDADIGAYQSADLILLNGADYAKWIGHVSLPASIQFNTSSVFKDRYLTSDGLVTHTHGKDGEHSHGSTAFTTWLDFNLATEQAEAVRDALASLIPEKAAVFDENAGRLFSDLQALDTEMKALGKKLNNQPLLASHPIYQYLTRRYSLNLQSVLWEPGAHPPAEEWANLDGVLAGHPAKLMLWEGEPHPDTAKALADRDITPVLFTQAGNRPASGDWLSAMRAGIANLEKVLE